MNLYLAKWFDVYHSTNAYTAEQLIMARSEHSARSVVHRLEETRPVGKIKVVEIRSEDQLAEAIDRKHWPHSFVEHENDYAGESWPEIHGRFLEEAIYNPARERTLIDDLREHWRTVANEDEARRCQLTLI